jgi:predicted ATPase/DNA-binding SARP family transcriptional activator
MSTLTLSFLGPPLVARDGAAITTGRRKALALLAYLAASESPRTREELTDLFYPGRDRGHARADFRNILSHLVRIIGHEHIVVHAGGVSLGRDGDLGCDAWDAARLVDDARAAEQNGDHDGAFRAFSEAAGLFRGEYLAGFSVRDTPDFDIWEEMERDRMRRQRAFLLGRLAALHEQCGELREAIDRTRELLALEPMDQRVIRALMRLLALDGDRAAAARLYEKIIAALRQDSAGEPDPETTRLHESLRQGVIPRVETPEAAARAANLPLQLTSFTGRRHELDNLFAAVRDRGARLLTLTGPGGSGKSRLAVEAATRLSAEFEHGAFLVDLAPVGDPGGVPSAIGAALGMRELRGERRSPAAQVTAMLRTRRLLLVLDNVDHVVAAASFVSDLLAACPRIVLVVTSTQALHLRAEHELPVPPLGLPGSGDLHRRIGKSEAVRLFVDRAASVLPDFRLDRRTGPLVADLCRLLDGMPLAIELAAAHLRVFPLPELLRKLGTRLLVLDRGPVDLPERQRTIAGEIRWSYDLLDEGERRLFRRLSVFAGSFDAEGAEAVNGQGSDETLAALADRSLVQRLAHRGGEYRFRMLNTVREFAADRLVETGKREEVYTRFVDHMIEIVERAEPDLYGPGQRQRFGELETERANCLAALDWLQKRGDRSGGLRLAGALGWFWFRRGRFAMGRQWLGTFHAMATGADPPGLRAKVAYLLGWMHMTYSLVEGGAGGHPEFFRQSLELFRQAGDRRGMALAQIHLASAGGDGTEGDPGSCAESIAMVRASGDHWATALCLIIQTYGMHHALESRHVVPHLEEAIALARLTGDPFLACAALTARGFVFMQRREFAAAEPLQREAMHLAREIGDPWSITMTESAIGISLSRMGRLEEGQGFVRASLRTAAEMGFSGAYNQLLGALDYIARLEGRSRRAVRLMAAAVKCLASEVAWNPSIETIGLDEETARAEWEAGMAMSTEQAIEYAMSNRD